MGGGAISQKQMEEEEGGGKSLINLSLTLRKLSHCLSVPTTWQPHAGETSGGSHSSTTSFDSFSAWSLPDPSPKLKKPVIKPSRFCPHLPILTGA